MRTFPLLFLTACGGASIDLEDGKDEVTDPAAATAPIYLETADTLYTWSPTEGPERIGAFYDVTTGGTLVGMSDIAIDADGILYGAMGSSLFRIDATTGACTFHATLPDHGTGLTFLPDGRLLVAGAGLTAVDLESGASEGLAGGDEFDTSGDVVAVPDGSIHWSVTGTTSDRWVRVDPDLGAATALGDTGVGSLWGVAWAEDTLYAFSADGTAWAVDADSGAASTVRTDGLGWYGATTNPVTW